MTLVVDLDVDVLKVYVVYQNEVRMSMHSEV